MIDNVNYLTTFLETQTFKDHVYAEAMRRELISDGYQFKLFQKLSFERNAIVLSIYIAKQKKIEVFLDLTKLGRGIDFRAYTYRRVIEELDIARRNEDFYKRTMETVETYCSINQNIEEENTNMDDILKAEIEKITANYNLQMSALVAEREREIADCKKAYERTKIIEDQNEAAFRQKAKMDALVTAGFTEQQAFEMIMKDL